MPTTPHPKDACDLLEADHRAVKKLFKDYEALMDSRADGAAERKRKLAREICLELDVHMRIEEEILYPALRTTLERTDLLAEAVVEHQSARDLIAQIAAGRTPDEDFDAHVKVLGEYIDHHVQEEQDELFPLVRATALDLVWMRDELQARKTQLLDKEAATA